LGGLKSLYPAGWWFFLWGGLVASPATTGHAGKTYGRAISGALCATTYIHDHRKPGSSGFSFGAIPAGWKLKEPGIGRPTTEGTPMLPLFTRWTEPTLALLYVILCVLVIGTIMAVCHLAYIFNWRRPWPPGGDLIPD
jgi:hypothetical protein